MIYLVVFSPLLLAALLAAIVGMVVIPVLVVALVVVTPIRVIRKLGRGRR